MTEVTAENAFKYVCELCDFKCSKLSNYNSHLLTRKHKKVTAGDINNANLIETKIYICKNCNKEYKSRNGLWLHNQKCNKDEDQLTIEDKELDDDKITISDAKMMFEILKQNNEFKELILNQSNQLLEQNKSMIELIKNNNIGATNNINNGNINNNNYNQFNIQMYLNETCKNAMTIDEFLDYLQPTIEELEATAHLGYVEGITRIIMRGLKDLEEELRPFHCSDLKRDSLFVKNPDGKWEKETDEKPLMLKFVKAVARKNFNNVNEWRKLHPNCRYHDSKSNDMFNQIMLNSSSGRTEEEQKASYEKIIKNITKEVVIDKSKKNKAK
jgi:hypothetical protein